MIATTSNPKITLAVIVVGLLLLYLKFQFHWILYLGIPMAIAGIVSKTIRTYIDWGWMKLAWILSLFVPKILLTLIFYGFLFPIAFISKLFKAKTGIELKNNKESFFKNTNTSFEPHFFEKPW